MPPGLLSTSGRSLCRRVTTTPLIWNHIMLSTCSETLNSPTAKQNKFQDSPLKVVGRRSGGRRGAWVVYGSRWVRDKDGMGRGEGMGVTKCMGIRSWVNVGLTGDVLKVTSYWRQTNSSNHIHTVCSWPANIILDKSVRDSVNVTLLSRLIGHGVYFIAIVGLYSSNRLFSIVGCVASLWCRSIRYTSC